MRLFITIAILLTTATSVRSGNYQLVRTPATISITMDGVTETTSRPAIIKRLHDYITDNADCEQPLLLAELLAATEHPRVMAAIYHAEGSYNGEEVGTSGELGPFQLMSNYRPDGYDRYDLKQNVDLAELVLAEKIEENGGKLSAGVRAYNGSRANPKAGAYRDRVLREAKRI